MSKVFPGNDGLVRRAELQYKNQAANEPSRAYRGRFYTTIERPVQRLIVIVPVDEADPTSVKSTAGECFDGNV